MNILQQKIIDLCRHITKVSEEFNANSEVPKMKDMDLTIQRALFDAYINQDEKDFLAELKEVESELGFEHPELYVDFISGLSLKWSKNGFKGQDGNWINPIDGGLCINSIYEILTSEKKKFWERGEYKYFELEPYSDKDLELINQLAWFDSPTSFVDRAITPFYTCLKIEEGKFPTQFYFYDSHLIYPLSFTSYEEYFTSLVASACIKCWQFFYTNPKEVIKTNIGKNHFTVFLKSPKIEDQNVINYNPEVTADRLDVIHGYLEHAVTALPEIFPKMDFSYHINWFKEFDKLYLESKLKSTD